MNALKVMGTILTRLKMMSKDELSFDEVELNYILESVRYFRDVKIIPSTERAIYYAELDNLIERIEHFLDGD